MLADEEHGQRRQITLQQEQQEQQQQQQQQHVSAINSTTTSTTNLSCPAGCLPAQILNEHHHHLHRYGQTNEKSLLDTKLQQQQQQQNCGTTIQDRYNTVVERFGSERSNSDRLPSGERYQGVSERYPLGERPQTSVSSERLLPKEILQTSGHCPNDTRQIFQPERYLQTYHYTDRTSCHQQQQQQPQRYTPERYTPIQNVGSLDRYHHHHHHHHHQSHNTLDRYSRTNTPTTERYHHTLSASEKEQRYTPTEPTTTTTTGSTTLQQQQTKLDGYGGYGTSSSDRHRTTKTQDIYKIRESERKQTTRYGFEQYISNNEHRFPPIPCPERFATQQQQQQQQERNNSNSERCLSFNQMQSVSYMEPPSPAPTNDRFIPPPPLSPDDDDDDDDDVDVDEDDVEDDVQTPNSDCFQNNAFPSPTTTVSTTERFIPPPPLSPSPTEQTYSPPSSKLVVDHQQQRYHHHHHQQQQQQQHHHLHHQEKRYNNDRYHHHISDTRYNKDRNYYINNTQQEQRYIPPNAHMPVERYVPQQQQEPYYGTTSSTTSYQYDRYTNNSKFNASQSDPYMRRDLAYHYRIPQQQQQSQQQQQQQRVRYQNIGTPNRIKCCQYQENTYQLVKSSPSSTTSSNSSVTSQQQHQQQQQNEQCQNYQQQEKGIQCNNIQCGGGKECSTTITTTSTTSNNNGGGFVSPNFRNIKAGCRHSICASPSVEYVGASGGRHVCATPPPPRGSICSMDSNSLCCNENCCNTTTTTRRSQTSLQVAVWRSSGQQPTNQQQQHVPTQQTEQQTQQINRSSTPTTSNNQQQQQQQDANDESSQILDEQHSNKLSTTPPLRTTGGGGGGVGIQRAISLPAPSPSPTPKRTINYSQSERTPNRPSLNRSLSRKEMIKNYIKRETANFFGVDEDNEDEQQIRWLDRRKRMATRTLGPLKEEYRSGQMQQQSHGGGGGGGVTSGGRSHWRTHSELLPTTMSRQLERPDVLPGSSDLPDSSIIHSDRQQQQQQQQQPEVNVRRKDSVARMTWDGLSYVVTTLTRHRPRPRSQQSQFSRSYPPETPNQTPTAEEQIFFEQPTNLPPSSPQIVDGGGGGSTTGGVAGGDNVDRPPPQTSYRPPIARGWRRDHQDQDVMLRHDIGVVRDRTGGGGGGGDGGRVASGGNRIFPATLDHVLDNSNRRQYGMGWIGRVFGRSLRKSIQHDRKIRQQLDDMEDHRPMFTYWVTIVQILVLCISLICYGFGPYGFDLQSRSGQVLVTSLSLQQVDILEPANFWFGPNAADLIHLGAKFAPCMRVDDKIIQQIDKIRLKERETACCIRNDDSGCVQSSQADCSKTISKWKKWKTGDAGPGGRISGSVCGLDPKFCDAPASVHPYEWPDDITKWPICRKKFSLFSMQKGQQHQSTKLAEAEHMVCEVIGHPCCIGIHGQCKITTREYCDFVRGTFHEEASLCSQVSCLNDVCGMLPFYFPETPDQFYRLWTSLFLHAGILQLIITILIQYFLMRDLEKLTGSLRIGIIYIGSGVAGNLASAIFVPYRADVGPAGSQFGLLACLIVEVLNAWPMLKHPNQALIKLLTILIFLFLLGLLPWVDNYAHLFGFIFGFLLSYALLPFITFGKYDRQKKIFLIWICLLISIILFIILILLFYIIPVYDCKICSYFNCIPFTRDFCASQNINFKREEPIV